MAATTDDEILYHGSKEAREELEGNDPGYRGSLGYGLYLTTDPEFARIYGAYIHEVVSPVPPELVAVIEPDAYECGQSMELYTPNSVPFTFRIVDRKTGKTHTYSVLGDCDDEVKASLRTELRGKYQPSARLKASVTASKPRVTAACGELWGKALAALSDVESSLYGKDMSDAVEDMLNDLPDSDSEGGLSDKEFKRTSSILSRTAKEMDVFVDKQLSARLGEEIGMDELSVTCERHGYSAFFISGYAPGDEYVIFDDKYLPLPVRNVERWRR